MIVLQKIKSKQRKMKSNLLKGAAGETEQFKAEFPQNLIFIVVNIIVVLVIILNLVISKALTDRTRIKWELIKGTDGLQREIKNTNLKQSSHQI